MENREFRTGKWNALARSPFSIFHFRFSIFLLREHFHHMGRGASRYSLCTIARNTVIALVLAGLCSSCDLAHARLAKGLQGAMQAEGELAAAGVVEPVSGSPLLIVASIISHDSVGTPLVILEVYNRSATTVSAFEIDATLTDDFGKGACRGGERSRQLQAQDRAIAPGEKCETGWTMDACDIVTRYQFRMEQVVMADGSIWKGPNP